MYDVVVLLFAVSVAVAILLIFKGVSVAIAILVAFLLYSTPLLQAQLVDVVVSSLNASTASTVVSLVLALYLANLYKSQRASEELVKGLSNIGPRVAGVLVPAIVGLLPMPAGAYISAVMVHSIYDKLGLNREQMTYINYWFRHIWVPIWPLYQGIILAAGLLGRSVVEVVVWTWPIALASLVSGVLVAGFYVFRGKSCAGSKGSVRGVIHVWPFALLSALTLVSHVPVYLAALVSIVLFTVVYRVHWREALKNLYRALDVNLIALVVLSMFFGESMRVTGLTQHLVGIVGEAFTPLLLFFLPFCIVLATGFEFTFVVLAFPPLKPLLSGWGLTIAYLGGFLGAMLSPSHACLVMSTRYFGAKIQGVYRYLVPSVAVTAAITVLIVVAH